MYDLTRNPQITYLQAYAELFFRYGYSPLGQLLQLPPAPAGDQ